MSNTNTNVFIGPVELPETQRLGDLAAVPRRNHFTGQVSWDIRQGDRMLWELDGVTAHQVMQSLRVMCKVQMCSASDTKQEIRRLLGVTT